MMDHVCLRPKAKAKLWADEQPRNTHYNTGFYAEAEVRSEAVSITVTINKSEKQIAPEIRFTLASGAFVLSCVSAWFNLSLLVCSYKLKCQHQDLEHTHQPNKI